MIWFMFCRLCLCGILYSDRLCSCLWRFPTLPKLCKNQLVRSWSYVRCRIWLLLFRLQAFNEYVPCALCITVQVLPVIMITWKNTCYSGWKLEYHEYLSTGFHYHAAASANVCFDINPESLEAWTIVMVNCSMAF